MCPEVKFILLVAAILSVKDYRESVAHQTKKKRKQMKLTIISLILQEENLALNIFSGCEKIVCVWINSDNTK